MSEICAEEIFVTFPWWLKNVKSRSKIALLSNERHFEIWFPKKRTITFSWSKLSKLHKKDPILYVATTFSLKQGETRTSHGPIPHPLTPTDQFDVKMNILWFWILWISTLRKTNTVGQLYCQKGIMVFCFCFCFWFFCFCFCFCFVLFFRFCWIHVVLIKENLYSPREWIGNTYEERGHHITEYLGWVYARGITKTLLDTLKEFPISHVLWTDYRRQWILWELIIACSWFEYLTWEFLIKQ